MTFLSHVSDRLTAQLSYTFYASNSLLLEELATSAQTLDKHRVLLPFYKHFV